MPRQRIDLTNPGLSLTMTNRRPFELYIRGMQPCAADKPARQVLAGGRRIEIGDIGVLRLSRIEAAMKEERVSRVEE